RPVAFGSSVPQWPTFLIPKCRRIASTTSWDVGPAGLSMRSAPSSAENSCMSRKSNHGSPRRATALSRERRHPCRRGSCILEIKKYSRSTCALNEWGYLNKVQIRLFIKDIVYGEHMERQFSRTGCQTVAPPQKYRAVFQR